MKLETDTPLRLDGTVVVEGLNGRSYVFKPDETGAATCDVDHEPTVAHLLQFGGYFPADELDHDAAVKLLEKSGEESLTGEEVDGDEEDDATDPNAAPLEANTPPASIAKPNKAPRAAKAAK